MRRLQARPPLVHALLRRGHCRERHVRGARALVEFRLRDRIRGEELCRALLLLLREAVGGERLIELASRSLQIGFRVRHLVFRRFHHRAVRGGRDGNRGLLLRNRRLRLRHGGARLRDGNLQIGRVQLDQQVALLHGLVVLHQHAHHRAGDARRHGGDVAIHLGVVGVLELARVQPPEERRHGHDGETKTDPQPHARLLRRFGGRVQLGPPLGARPAIALAPLHFELLF